MLFALTVIGGRLSLVGSDLRRDCCFGRCPALLTDWNVDGNIATMVFGAGLLHALITAPQGISGQVVGLGAPRRQTCRLDAARDGAETVIEIRNVTVEFGGVRGFNDLTADVSARSPGLSGRTAPARRRCSMSSAASSGRRSGTVKLDGEDLLAHRRHRRAAFGIRRTFQTEQVVENLTVWNNVAAALDNVPPADAPRRDLIAEALGLCRLEAPSGARWALRSTPASAAWWRSRVASSPSRGW